jgi:Fe-S-cluster containining protein
MTVRVLSFHAGYGCRRSGACCTAGWPIAAEARVQTNVREALGRGALRLHVSTEPFTRAEDGTAVLALDGQCRCVFFEPGTPHACSIHRQFGHEWLPLACRQFPRISLLTPMATSVTLSHYCPTAAGLLFEGGAVGIVDDASAFPAGAEYEGLDARAALPLLRPGVFLDWESHRRWEEHAVATLAREDLRPEAALERLRADAEEARAWTPGRGPLIDWIERIAGALDTRTAAAHADFDAAVASWRLAVACVPAPEPQPPALDEAAAARSHVEHVAPAWPAFAAPIRRYLAAKAFASWCAVQGQGLRTAVAFLTLAHGVLRVEAARSCAMAGGALDASSLTEAIRAADLLLVHLADPQTLAGRLDLALASR